MMARLGGISGAGEKQPMWEQKGKVELGGYADVGCLVQLRPWSGRSSSRQKLDRPRDSAEGSCVRSLGAVQWEGGDGVGAVQRGLQ